MRRDYIVGLVASLLKEGKGAEEIVDKLIDEGIFNEHYGNQEVSGVIETFKQTFGTTATSKYDRFAASRMVKKHGTESVVAVVKALGLLKDREYAPVVNNVSQMERKWASIVSFLNNQRSSEEIKSL